MTTTQNITEISTAELLAMATARPWHVDIGNYANTGQIFLEGRDPCNHYKQHVARLGYAYTAQGEDCREANAELIRRMAQSFEALREALEYCEAGLDDCYEDLKAYGDEKRFQQVMALQRKAKSALALSEGKPQ